MSSVDRENKSIVLLFLHTIQSFRFYGMNNEISWLADDTPKLFFFLLAKLEPNSSIHYAKLSCVGDNLSGPSNFY